MTAGATGESPPGHSHSGDGCPDSSFPQCQDKSIETINVAWLLSSIGLEHLRDIFEREQITLDIIVELCHYTAFYPDIHREKYINSMF